MIFLMKEARSRNTGTQGKLNSLSSPQSPRPPRVEGVTRWCDRSTGSGAWLTTVPFRSLRRLLPGPCFSEVRSGAWPLGPSCVGQRWAWAQRLRFPRPLLILFHLSPHPQRRLGEEEEDGPGFCPSSVGLAPEPVSSPVRPPLGYGEGKGRRCQVPARYPETSQRCCSMREAYGMMSPAFLEGVQTPQGALKASL